MKKLLLTIMMFCAVNNINAQTDNKKDSLDYDIKGTVEKLYKTVVPLLDRVEFTGNGEVSQELQARWNNVMIHLKNNKEFMADEVKKLLISPTGKSIDLNMVKQFINVSGKDSTMKININPEFLLDELKAMSDRIVKESSKMAEKSR